MMVGQAARTNRELARRWRGSRRVLRAK